MSTKSKIEWTDATWNPVRGCKKISVLPLAERNALAARMADLWPKACKSKVRRTA